MNPEAVRLEQVARRFGRRWALRGVSLRVAAGEVVVLLGRNGSGKTTLLRVLATALRPTRGGGAIFGHDLVAEADRVRAHVGYLGHEPGHYPDLTARENLEFGLRMRGAGRGASARAAIDAALEDVALAHAAEERVRGFSAGMRRRLALARVVLGRPRLLLLDEPHASFDADGIRLVHRIAREVRAGGGAVVVATHDPDRAAAVADRWVHMVDGRVVELEGAPAADAHVAPVMGGVA